MKGIAQIFHPNGGTILPATSSYEFQLVREHAEAYAKRHGRVRLEVNRHQWLVTAANDAGADDCVRCRSQLQGLVYQNGSGAICGHCALRAMR